MGQRLALAILDADQRICYASERLCQALERQPDRLFGEHWLDLVHQEDRDQLVRTESTLRSFAGDLGSLVLEWRTPTSPSGEETWFESRVTTLTGGNQIIGWLVAALEVTERRRAHQELAKSERRLHKIVNGSSDVITILSDTAEVRWSSTDRVLDYDNSNAPHGAFDVIHPEDRQGIMETFARGLERRHQPPKRDMHEYRALRRDGVWRWMETAATNLVDDEDIAGIVLHTRDVTNRRQAMEELRAATTRLESLVANLAIAVALVDRDGRYSVVNRAFTDILGSRDPFDIVGKVEDDIPDHILEQLVPVVGDLAAALARRRQIVAANTLVLDERIVLANASTYARTFIPIAIDGQPAGHLWLYRNLTDELAAQAEREQLLLTRLAQNRRLLELDVARSNLLAAISHELRTPLTSVVAATELLRDGVGQADPEEQIQHLDVITRNAERLLRSVDDLLMIDEVESQQLTVELAPLNLSEVVEMAVSSITPAAEDKGVALISACQEGPPLSGDRVRLGQVIDNLLTNAVKFTPSGGAVEVRAVCLGESWKLTVSDTGVGMSESERSLVFRRSFRGSNAHQLSVPGSGLGLTIAAGIVERHGGTIGVTSEEGKGTTFTVALPVVPPSPGE